MKLFLCENIRLGAECSEKLDVESSRKWENMRIRKLEEIISKAALTDVSYIMFFGELFGRERVTESLLDTFFTLAESQLDVNIIAFVNRNEYKRISYRKDVPENIHFICIDEKSEYVYNGLNVSIFENIVSVNSCEKSKNVVHISAEKDNTYTVNVEENEYEVPFFEPEGYDDVSKHHYGYGILELSDDEAIKYNEITNCIFSYEILNVNVLPEDNNKEIMKKLLKATAQYSYETFLRINLIGKSAFGLIIEKTKMMERLGERIFHVEIFDSTVMDIDAADFENDISLKGEFVRLVLNDESLSVSERNKILRYGWNVLNSEAVL